MIKDAYRMKGSDVLQTLRVNLESGLSMNAIPKRRSAYGANALPRGKGRSPIFLFLDRFKDVLVLVLLGAAGISLLLNRIGDTFIILAALLVDASLSFAQVWRTENTLKKLRSHTQTKATVIRENGTRVVLAKDLVVGDIIEIRAGERIPADARLLKVNGLKTNESSLTGESDDVEKETKALKARVVVSSRKNMVFMGTTIVNGSGLAVVVAVGPRTEVGKIAQMIKINTAPPSPLRRKLQKTGLQIGSGIVVAVIVLFLAGLARGQDLLETSLTAITLVVSAVPEDLTMILTIALTVGVARILKNKGAVKGLASGETLEPQRLFVLTKQVP